MVAPRAVQDALGTLSARLGRLEQAERATLSACTALSMVSPASPANGAALAEAPAARAELAGVAPAEEPSESEEARRESERIVDTAISAGHWTEADKLNLRTSFVGLGAESRAELLQTLSRHINDGTLRIEMAGPPF